MEGKGAKGKSRVAAAATSGMGSVAVATTTTTKEVGRQQEKHGRTKITDMNAKGPLKNLDTSPLYLKCLVKTDKIRTTMFSVVYKFLCSDESGHIDVVCNDAREGERLHRKFRIGKTYRIIEGSLAPSNPNYTLAENAFQLKLKSANNVLECEGEPIANMISHVPFNFVSLGGIKNVGHFGGNKELAEGHTVDLIGVVERIDPEKSGYTLSDDGDHEVEFTRKTILLKDSFENNFTSILVTLWDDKALNVKKTGTVIVIKNAKIGAMFDGQHAVNVSKPSFVFKIDNTTDLGILDSKAQKDWYRKLSPPRLPQQKGKKAKAKGNKGKTGQSGEGDASAGPSSSASLGATAGVTKAHGNENQAPAPSGATATAGFEEQLAAENEKIAAMQKRNSDDITISEALKVRGSKSKRKPFTKILRHVKFVNGTLDKYMGCAHCKREMTRRGPCSYSGCQSKVECEKPSQLFNSKDLSVVDDEATVLDELNWSGQTAKFLQSVADKVEEKEVEGEEEQNSTPAVADMTLKTEDYFDIHLGFTQKSKNWVITIKEVYGYKKVQEKKTKSKKKAAAVPVTLPTAAGAAASTKKKGQPGATTLREKSANEK